MQQIIPFEENYHEKDHLLSQCNGVDVSGGAKAFAQEEAQFDKPDWKKDFSVTIGVKVWVNEWQRDSFVSNRIGTPTLEDAVFNLGQGLISPDIGPGFIRTIAEDTSPDTQESDFEPVPIPQVSVKYKRLFVTASYYAETEFDFPSSQRTASAEFVFQDDTSLLLAERTTIDEFTGKRYEWDTAVGWYMHPYVAVLVGYKEIDQKITQTINTTDVFFPGLQDLDVFFPDYNLKASLPLIPQQAPVSSTLPVQPSASRARFPLPGDSASMRVTPTGLWMWTSWISDNPKLTEMQIMTLLNSDLPTPRIWPPCSRICHSRRPRFMQDTAIKRLIQIFLSLVEIVAMSPKASPPASI